MFVGELEDDGIIGELVTEDGVLGDDAVFVFDFHGDGSVWEVSTRLLEDGRHFSGLDAVFVVLADPDLQLAGDGFTELAAAVEEDLVDATDLSDVK